MPFAGEIQVKPSRLILHLTTAHYVCVMGKDTQNDCKTYHNLRYAQVLYIMHGTLGSQD